MPTIEDIKATNGEPHLAWGRIESLRDHCFLCDVPLTTKNRTGEDVLPRWLQRMFRLQAGASLRLLNGTSLRYGSIRIPCCKTCNNEWLSRAENDVQRAFSAGYEAVADRDPDLMYAWLAKVFYGVLYREALLPMDRAEADSQAIVSAEGLSSLAMYRMLLQWFRDKAHWSTAPGSVFLYRAQTLPEVGHNFDLADSVRFECIALRIGSTAVVAALSDWGFLRELAPKPLTFPSDVALHPIQFRQLYATVVDYEMRRRFQSCYTATAIGDEVDALLLDRCLHRLTEPAYEDHDHAAWGGLLSFVTGIPWEAIADGDRVRNFLKEEDGTPRMLPFQGGTGVLVKDGQEYAFPENPAIGMFASRSSRGTEAASPRSRRAASRR